ncbi:CBL-interacting serine/threonine-protein kinase 25-like [Argentina anserina]|uniref:CBL-interacting serine/threonine-protein kinase 25-like n=1 Tax=Argentina anserina TaxID=57926 RepID=UPI00217635E6|nr:CBL-interacting serine/threonine-protein kinase 25-like [Potentilla anserina]
MESGQQQLQPQNPDQRSAPRNIIFDKYEMGRLLGQGTFAKVYHGKNLATSESVAIKVINKDHIKKEGLVEQIKREISIMHLVHHPHIVELKEVMATKTKIFFIMEHVKGGELFEKIIKGKLKEDVARKYFQQLIFAVDFCHSRGVAHRDLKPENLLLDENEDLKVSDFGLSALPEQHWSDGMLHTQCGTPAYVAPEILRKKGYDGAKADLWSCGVVLFVFLAGYLPFHDENAMRTYRKVFKAEYRFPPWISGDARRLIRKLLVVDPENRASVSELMKDPWFQKGSSSNLTKLSLHEENETEKSQKTGEKIASTTTTTANDTSESPPFFNAFEFISSMSSGFDLSHMFEKKKRTGSMFTSKCSAAGIKAKLQVVAERLNFRVVCEKEFKVKLLGKTEGRKGKLAVVAEVFQIAEEVAVVEFSKLSGDTLEYTKFCEEDVRPAIKDIVWTWQGEENKYARNVVGNVL